MTSAMSVSPIPAAEEIQRQMSQVRSELREDVQEIVENARTMAEWRFYVRSYPWLCLGAAAAAGYLLVPPRMQIVRPDSRVLADLIRQQQVTVRTEVQPQRSGGLLGQLVNMAAGVAVQGVLAVASQQLNKFVNQLATISPPPPAVAGDPSHEEPHR